jgi:hypothetical protein
VRAADGYEVGGWVRFSAPGWSQTVPAHHGVATVTLPGTLRGGEQAVTAEYLCYDYLTASQDSEPVTILATRVSADAPVGGDVPATLSLALGAPASFGAFTPGVAKTYTASTTATVPSTASDAVLSVSAVRLNGVFELAQPVGIAPAKTAWTGTVQQRRLPDRVHAVHRRIRDPANRGPRRQRHSHVVDYDAVVRLAARARPAVS